MVAAGDDDPAAAAFAANPGQEVVVHSGAGVSGSVRVEEIPRDQQHVDRFPGDQLQEPGEEVAELPVPAPAAEQVAEMPVGRVQQSHIRSVEAPLR